MSTEGVAVVEKILIAVVGDSGCGKSSLVRALSPPRQSSNEENDTLVDGVCKELLLKTKDGLGIHVRDTLEETAQEALAWCNVALLIVDAHQGRLDEALQKWGPKVPNHVPVVLVGTQIDKRLRVVPELPWSKEERERLLSDMADSSMPTKLQRILKKWTQVGAYLEVSSLYKLNLEFVFSAAVAAIRAPILPLLESNTGNLSKEFRKALRRIFFLLDKDADGRLSEVELTEYHAVALSLEGDALKEAVRATVLQLKKEPGDWSAGGATYQGFEGAFHEMLQTGHSAVAWEVLRKYDYDGNLDIGVKIACDSPDFARSLEADSKRVRLAFSPEAISWLEGMSRRASNITNVKALISLLPQGLLSDEQWPMDDIVSGDVVAVSGNGLPKPSWLALWFLLLEANDLECAKRAELMGRVLGFKDSLFITTEPSPLRCCRILIAGSGEQSRSLVMRGAICGAQRKIDDQLSSERIVFSCGKLSDHIYGCAFAPKRLPENLDRFDLMVVPFDVKDGEQAFFRAASWALICSSRLPVVFATSHLKTVSPATSEWMEKRHVRCLDASDPEGLRRALVLALSTPGDSILKPLPGDVTVMASQSTVARGAPPRDWFRILMVVLAISILMSTSWISRVLNGIVPSSVISVALSVIAAALVYRFVISYSEHNDKSIKKKEENHVHSHDGCNGHSHDHNHDHKKNHEN